jgi:hypothetical protein
VQFDRPGGAGDRVQELSTRAYVVGGQGRARDDGAGLPDAGIAQLT